MDAKTLSASKIKTIESCSWMYWLHYEQKVPQLAGEGASRGLVVHLILELLLLKKHLTHYELIISNNHINGSPAVSRLLIKLLKRHDILSTDNYGTCNNMILVGLKTDFFGAGGKLGEPEFKFELSNENPKYAIRGYIDKLVFYDDGTIKIVDYKSSKSKFSGDDLEANTQAMVYSLVGYKMFAAKNVIAEFVFLRYEHKPVQTVRLTQEQILGFETYLAYMYEFINNFTENNAKDNFAAYNAKNKWMCKTGAWICPYFNKFSYYALIDNNNNVVQTSMKKEDLKPTGEQAVIELQYNGCPPHKNISIPKEL